MIEKVLCDTLEVAKVLSNFKIHLIETLKLSI